jgi:MFS family permease
VTETRQSLIALSALSFLLAAVQTGFGPFVSVWLTESGLSQRDIGLALSVGTISGMIGQLPAGMLIDTLPNRRLLIGLALAVLAASAVMIGQFPTLVPTMAAQVLHGLASCVLVPAIAALTLALVGHDTFGERVGINARYSSVGNAMFAAVLGVWATWLPERGVLLLTAAMVLPALGALLLIRPTHLANPIEEQEITTVVPPAQLASRWRDLLGEPGFVPFLVCAAVFHLANAAMLPLALNTYVAGEAGADWIVAASIIMPQLVVALLSPWVGRIAQSWGRRPVLLIGFLALPIRGLICAVLPNPILLVPLQLLDGISAAVFGIMVPLIAADTSRRLGCLNLAISAINLSVALGATFSTTLAGIIADSAGSRPAFLALSAAGMLAAFLVLRVMPETRPASPIPVM